MRRRTDPYERLLNRADFVAAAKGARIHAPDFVLQARRRAEPQPDAPPRFGITLTKKTLPRAVDRNRVRRRLREALRLGAALSGAPCHDYVIVGRPPLLDMAFADLATALAAGVEAATRRGARKDRTATAQAR